MKYNFDDYVKSIIYYTRKEYVEKILSSREQTYYAIYQVRTNKNEYFIKLFSEENQANIEENALYYLRKASYIKVPKIYNVFEKTDDVPYSAVVMEKITDGKILTRIPSKIKDKLIKDIVKSIIYKDNDYDKNSFGEIGKEKYATWQEYYKKRAKEDTEKAKVLLGHGKISIELYLDIQNKFYNFDKIFSETVDRATLIHGNYSIDNLFVNEDSAEVVALINPHIPMYGDKEYEAISLDPRKNNGLNILEEYRRSVDLSPNFDAKYDFYYLFDIIERKYSILDTFIKKEHKNGKNIKKIIKKYKYDWNISSDIDR